MKLKLKICGMRDAENMAEVGVLQPDYMGFIFYEKSPRYVGENFDPLTLSSSIKKVGIFVNEQTDRIIRTVSEYQLDFVQLHGNETPEQCAVLKEKGVDVIKAFSVDETFDFADVNPYKQHVRYFLFDTKGQHFGGNAKVFDWSLLNNYDQIVPFFLSGGISPENVREINKLSKLNIHALDVNSGVEDAPGLKNVNRIKKLKEILTVL